MQLTPKLARHPPARDVPRPRAQQRWIHSTCSRKKLARALADPTITAIETDIVAGKPAAAAPAAAANGSASNGHHDEPVLAHPPATSSDLPFDEFLERCISDGTRHLKLDFKELSIVEPVLRRVATAWPRLAANGQMVWLNADVLPGPNTRSYAVAIPPEQFVPLCRRLCPHATLSLGWRTAAIGPEEAYTQRDADAMAKLCSDHALPGSAVVFAAAVRFAECALPPLIGLLQGVPGSQMLLWTGTGEPPIRLASKVRVLAAFAAAGLSDAVGFDVQLADSSLRAAQAVLIDCTFFWSRWLRFFPGFVCCLHRPRADYASIGERQPLVGGAPAAAGSDGSLGSPALRAAPGCCSSV